jgi:hypothetical protein
LTGGAKEAGAGGNSRSVLARLTGETLHARVAGLAGGALVASALVVDPPTPGLAGLLDLATNAGVPDGTCADPCAKLARRTGPVTTADASSWAQLAA